ANIGQAEALLARLTDEGVRANVRQAVERARHAEADRARAVGLAQQAAHLHHAAETRAVTGIMNALNNSGIKNASWWTKLWDLVSAPFLAETATNVRQGTLAEARVGQGQILRGPGIPGKRDIAEMRAELDRLRSLGVPPSQYKDLLQAYWVAVAAQK